MVFKRLLSINYQIEVLFLKLEAVTVCSCMEQAALYWTASRKYYPAPLPRIGNTIKYNVTRAIGNIKNTIVVKTTRSIVQPENSIILKRRLYRKKTKSQ